jgi:nitroreductase
MDQLREMVQIAARSPDHGKLAPWRFVIVPDEQREALATLLADSYRAEKPEAGRLELEAMLQYARQAPALIVVLASPKQGNIPVWEQELSVGAATMNLLHAAHALGFAGGWLTGWPSYHEAVRNAFGSADERIAGFVFIGTPSRELDERPRPALDDIVSVWQGPA